MNPGPLATVYRRMRAALVVLLLPRLALAQFAGPVGPIAPPPPCFGSATYEVQAGAAAAGDGSAARPFATIDAALARAQATRACEVTVRVGDGVYDRPLVITRTTALLGESRAGTIVSGAGITNAGSNLRVESMTIRGAPAPAALVVETGAAATLRQVTISSARGVGVAVHGGTLSMVGSSVTDTAATGSTVATGWGIGVAIDGGGRADLRDVSLARNRSNGLAVRGDGSRAILRLVTVTDTDRNRSLTDGNVDASVRPLLGAISVSDGAELFADHVGITRSVMEGLAVTRARANVRDSTVAETTRFAGRGSNVVLSDSTVELTGVRSHHAASFGIALRDAWVLGADLEVDHNQTGLGFESRPAGWDARCLPSTEIALHDNVSAYSNSSTSPSDAPSIGPEAPPVCRTVPWP